MIESAVKIKLRDVRPMEHYDLNFTESTEGVSLMGTMRALDWFEKTYVKRCDVRS